VLDALLACDEKLLIVMSILHLGLTPGLLPSVLLSLHDCTKPASYENTYLGTIGMLEKSILHANY